MHALSKRILVSISWKSPSSLTHSLTDSQFLETPHLSFARQSFHPNMTNWNPIWQKIQSRSRNANMILKISEVFMIFFLVFKNWIQFSVSLSGGAAGSLGLCLNLFWLPAPLRQHTPFICSKLKFCQNKYSI